jgi:hypothetical protein
MQLEASDGPQRRHSPALRAALKELHDSLSGPLTIEFCSIEYLDAPNDLLMEGKKG